MKYKIKTLKDLQDLLASIPNKDLELFGIGHNMEGDGEISVITIEDYYDLFEKYPQLDTLNKYLEKICKAHERTLNEKDDLEDVDDFIEV